MLVVDGANVVGSRPNGWWRDRAGAAEKLRSALVDAVRDGRLDAPVVVVLEGAARRVAEGEEDGVRVVHAAGHGDDGIVATAEQAVSSGEQVTVVTADRELRGRVERLGGSVVGPRWLLDLMPDGG